MFHPASTILERRHRKRNDRLVLEQLEDRRLLAITALLDFTADFQEGLDKIADHVFGEDAGFYDGDAIADDIGTHLNQLYADYNVTFVTSGNHDEEIDFVLNNINSGCTPTGTTTTQYFYGPFGCTEDIDPLNLGTSTIEIYTTRFAEEVNNSPDDEDLDFENDPTGTIDDQEDELARSLALIAAHELGHALGLFHEFSLGDTAAGLS